MDRDEFFGSVLRVIFGLLFALVAIGLLGTSREFLGFVALLICVSILVKGSAEIIVMLVASLFVVILILVIIWSPFGLFAGVGFVGWAIEHWYIFAFYAGLAVYALVRNAAAADSTWDILSETYRAGKRKEADLEGYPSEMGHLKIGEEFTLVTAYQISSGILVVRNRVDPLLFRWDRIVRISRSSGDKTKAVLHLRKKMGPPLEIEIPWSPKFRTKIGGKSGAAST